MCILCVKCLFISIYSHRCNMNIICPFVSLYPEHSCQKQHKNEWMCVRLSLLEFNTQTQKRGCVTKKKENDRLNNISIFEAYELPSGKRFPFYFFYCQPYWIWRIIYSIVHVVPDFPVLGMDPIQPLHHQIRIIFQFLVVLLSQSLSLWSGECSKKSLLFQCIYIKWKNFTRIFHVIFS